MSTLDYYNDNAVSYFNSSLNADMSLAYECFLKHITDNAFILDFGCGCGRDSKYFLDNGYKVECIDGSEKLCHLAREYLNHEVKCMRFEELSEIEKYDGIWACSSLLHIPKNEFKGILIKLRDALKNCGILYISLKNGSGEEFLNGRGYIWGRTIPVILENPLLGTGPDTFMLTFPQNDYVARSNLGHSFFSQIITNAHNLYLHMAAQTGIPSLLCFLTFVIIYIIS